MAMRQLLRRSVFRFAMALAFVSGLGCLGVAAWLQPLVDAERDRRDGNQERALSRYVASQTRFDRWPWSRLVLSQFYDTGQSNVFWLLYRRQEYDAIIERGEAMPSFAPAHYWAGCASFAKAVAESKLDRRTALLRRAEEEFRKALTIDAGDWDSKFNYEIARRMREKSQQQPSAAPPKSFKLLRPGPSPANRPTRRAG